MMSAYYTSLSPLSKVPILTLPAGPEGAFGSVPVKDDPFTGIVGRVLLAATGGVQLPTLSGDVYIVDPLAWVEPGKVPTPVGGFAFEALLKVNARFVQVTPAQASEVWSQLVGDWSQLLDDGDSDDCLHPSRDERLERLVAALRQVLPAHVTLAGFCDAAGLVPLPEPVQWRGNFSYETCVEVVQALVQAFALLHPRSAAEFSWDGTQLRVGRRVVRIAPDAVFLGAGRRVRKGLLALYYPGQSRFEAHQALPATEYTLLVYALTYGVDFLRRGALQELYGFLERFLPLESEEQAMAAADADRGLYLEERYTPICVTGEYPLTVVGKEAVVGLAPDRFHVATLLDNESDLSNALADNGRIPTGLYDLAVLRAYGLVKHISAGSRSYIGGRLNAVFLRDVPAAERREFLLKAVALTYKVEPTPAAVAAALRKAHGEALAGLQTDEEVLAYCEEQGLIPFTTKVSKPKRSLAEFALCAELVNGKPRWFARPGHPPAEGVELAAVIAPLAYSPGVAILLSTEGVDTRYIVGSTHAVSYSGKYALDAPELFGPARYGKITPVQAGTLAAKERTFQYVLELPAQEVQELWVEANDPVLAFTAEDGTLRYVHAGHAGYLRSVEWSEKLVGKQRVLEVQVRTNRYYSIDEGMKARGAEIKALLHRGLNDDVVQGDFVAHVVVTNDTLKGTDLLSGLLPVMAQTMWESPVEECREAIRAASRLSGDAAADERFIYSELVAATGGYDALVQVFEKYYLHKDVWFKFGSLHAGEHGWHAVWRLVQAKAAAGVEFERVEGFALPAQAQGLAGVEVYRHLDTGNVLVFGHRDGLLEVHQRCPYVYAGTAATGPVKVNWKVELSSVQQAVTTTATQASVIRYVAEQGDLEFAKALMADGEQHRTRFAVLTAGYYNRRLAYTVGAGERLMPVLAPVPLTAARAIAAAQAQGLLPKWPGQALRRWQALDDTTRQQLTQAAAVTTEGASLEYLLRPARFWAAYILGRAYGLFQNAGRIAAAKELASLSAAAFDELLRTAVQRAQQEGRLATLLTDGFGCRAVQLYCRLDEDALAPYWLHLGTLLNKHTEEEGPGTLAGRVLAALTDLLLSGQWSQAAADGIYAGLRRMLESKKPQKRLVTGRVGLNSKSIALPGLDPSKLYVRYSRQAGSFYRQFAQLVGSEKLDGRKVLLSRAPMNAAAVLYVEVVHRGHPLYERMNDYQVVTDLLPIYIDAGDCDGDGRTVVDAVDCRLEPLGVEGILNMISERTGLSPAEEVNYLADHLLGFKNFRKTKRAFTLIGREGALAPDSPANWTSDYALLIHRAHLNQIELVGVAYRVAEYGDRYVELYRGSADKPLHAEERWALPLYNVYETLLGGLSKEMYALVQGWLRPALGGFPADEVLVKSAVQVEATDSALRKLMREAGLNERLYDAMVSLVQDVRVARDLRRLVRKGLSVTALGQGELWRHAACHLSYVVAKGEPLFPRYDVATGQWDAPPDWRLLQLLVQVPAFQACSDSIVVEQLKRVADLAGLYSSTVKPVVVTFRSRRRSVEAAEVVVAMSGGLTPDTMTSDQRKVYEAFITGRNVIYSGAAGTGKTTLARYLIDLARADKANHVLVMSTTGNGAKVLGCGATTVHKALALGAEGGCLPPGEVRKPGFRHRMADTIIADSRVRARLYKPGKRTVVFIDEVFRLSPQTLHIAVEILRQVTNGNVQFVLFGDPAQGAPVPAHADDPVEFTWEQPVWRLRNAAGEVVHTIERPALNFADFQLVTLEQVVRQGSDSDYARMLNRMRLGDKSKSVLDFFKTRTLGQTAEVPDETSTYLYASNKEVAEHNARVVAKYVAAGAASRTYVAYFNGKPVDELWARRYPEIAKEVEPVSPQLLLVQGMRAMVRQECRSLDGQALHNGEEGVLLELHDDHVVLQLDGHAEPVRVGRVPIHLPLQHDGTDHPDKYEQLPLCLSAAMTVAKSQGLTKVAQRGADGKLLPSSLLVVRTYGPDGRPSIIGSGDLYVALSRTQVIEQMVIDHVAPNGRSTLADCVVADPRVIAFLEKGAGIVRATVDGREYRVKVGGQAPHFTLEVMGVETLNLTVRYGRLVPTTAAGEPVPVDDAVVQAALPVLRAQVQAPVFRHDETAHHNGHLYHSFEIVGVEDRLVLLRDGDTVQVVNPLTEKLLATFPLAEYLWANELLAALPSDPPDGPAPPVPPHATSAVEARLLSVQGSTYTVAVGSAVYTVRAAYGCVQVVDGGGQPVAWEDGAVQAALQAVRAHTAKPTLRYLGAVQRDGVTYHRFGIVEAPERTVVLAENRVYVGAVGTERPLAECPLSQYLWAAELTELLPAEGLPPVVHVKLHEYDVAVDRSGPWGNPFSHNPYANALHHPQLQTREDAVRAFEDWLLRNDLGSFSLSLQQRQNLDAKRRWILQNAAQLRGKRLACWCVQQPTAPTTEPRSCHAMTLALLAAGRLQPQV
jgi:hypothetical protein